MSIIPSKKKAVAVKINGKNVLLKIGMKVRCVEPQSNYGLVCDNYTIKEFVTANDKYGSTYVKLEELLSSHPNHLFFPYNFSYFDKSKVSLSV